MKVMQALLIVAVVFSGSMAVAGQDTVLQARADTLKVYAYGSVKVLEGDEAEFDFRWARLGLWSHWQTELGKVRLRTEYDLARSKATYIYGQWYHPVGDDVLSVLLGQQLMLSNKHVTPGPDKIRLTRWPDFVHDLPVYFRGMSIYYIANPWQLRAAYAGGLLWDDERQKGWQTSVHYGALRAWWVQDLAQGALLDFSLHDLVNPYIGWANHEQQHGTQFFVQNYIQLPTSIDLRLYTRYDFSNRRRGAGLVGFCWQYAPGNFVKVYYDDRSYTTGSLQRSGCQIEITWQF